MIQMHESLTGGEVGAAHDRFTTLMWRIGSREDRALADRISRPSRRSSAPRPRARTRGPVMTTSPAIPTTWRRPGAASIPSRTCTRCSGASSGSTRLDPTTRSTGSCW